MITRNQALPIGLNRTSWKHDTCFQLEQVIARPKFNWYTTPEERNKITLGQTTGGQYLVVVHTFDQVEDNKVEIRIISVRKATRQEIQQYEGGV